MRNESTIFFVNIPEHILHAIDPRNNINNNNNNIQICTRQCSINQLKVKDYELQSIDSLSNKSIVESEAIDLLLRLITKILVY